jgi:hypothetical protein
MSEPSANELKKCKYCGKMTSTEANFCYYCTRELVARPERPAEEPKPARINWVVVGMVVLALVALAYLLFLPR